AAFAVWAMTVGLRNRREASRDLRSYFLAGRRLTSWESGLSMTATQYAADTPLLAAGLVATGGVFALWRLWSYGIAFLLLGLLLGSAWWRSGVVTDAELCEVRYGGRRAAWLRGVKAVYYGLVFNCAVLAMVLAAAVRVAEPFLPWHEWLSPDVFAPAEAIVRAVGVPLSADPEPNGLWARSASNLISVVAIFGFTLAYSATGGLRSVTRTDLGQIVVLSLATLLYAYFAVRAAGGLSNLPEALAASVGPERAAELLSFHPWGAAEAGAALLAVLGLQWLFQMNSDGTGYLAQRCMACRSPADARRAPVVFAFAQIVLRSLLWLPIVLALVVIFPLSEGQTVAERELTFVRGIETLLPAGARGLMLVGMLAALASTLDTHLNWGASYLANDLYARVLCRGVFGREPRPRELVWVARGASPLLMALALFVMASLGSIQAAWHVTLLLGAGLGAPLLLRWLWSRANAWGELAALVFSGFAAVALLASDVSETARLLTVAVVGALSSVLASLATRPESEERLAAFYERVRPPGFWGRPEARRALRDRLLALAAAAGSLYGTLLGLGVWLVGAPAPFGSRPVFITLALLGAAALVPFWWRELNGEEA
ncbi:MAG: sodium transporter, partial [Myxococcota bacterium]